MFDDFSRNDLLLHHVTYKEPELIETFNQSADLRVVYQQDSVTKWLVRNQDYSGREMCKNDVGQGSESNYR